MGGKKWHQFAWQLLNSFSLSLPVAWDKVPAPCDSLGITDRWLYLNRPVCSENPGLLRFLKTTFSFFPRVFTCGILNLSFFFLWHFCNRSTGDQFSESSLMKKPHTSSNFVYLTWFNNDLVIFLLLLYKAYSGSWYLEIRKVKLLNETLPANHAGRELLMLALIRVKQMGFLVMHMGCGSIIKPRRKTRQRE